MFGRPRKLVTAPAAPAAPIAPTAPVAPPTFATRTTPSNLSNAIGQLKAGNVFDAQNSLRQSVGLPTVAQTPAARTTPTPATTPAPAVAPPQVRRGLAGAIANNAARKMAPQVAKMKSGGKVSAASRGDGIAQRGKTKGRYL